jgi:Cu-processing system ATP-binding protein
MIDARDITKSFGKLKVLNRVSISCARGETVSLIGPNGSGKTTFIKCLLGMVLPDSGTILFNNADISKNWDYRKDIGYMPQMGRYPDNMTIGQIFDMMLDLRKKKLSESDTELINAFG